MAAAGLVPSALKQSEAFMRVCYIYLALSSQGKLKNRAPM